MITLHQISKSFGGVPVLRDISLTLAPGSTLGLAGENGAGKSTLMNIIGGNLQPDNGSMSFGGRSYEPKSPLDAVRHGIAFIHQELNLFTNLTVAENLFLTSFPRQAGCLIHRKQLLQQTAKLLYQVGLNIPPGTPIERLSAGERQLVEVAKALSLDARLIIFDEPTTSLSARECERLFTLLASLRERGVSIIYISHTLPDLLQISDHILVLRDGAIAGAGTKDAFTIEKIISLMVGRSLDQLYPQRYRQTSNKVVLEAQNLSRRGTVRNVSFRLFAGEVLGISGLMGAGRSELARILFGLDSYDAGQVLLNGAELGKSKPRSRIRHGMAFLTENRREEGLCMDASILSNIALTSLKQHARWPFGLLRIPALVAKVRSVRDAVRLTPSAKDSQPVKTLSGGNQQKVVLAKWLLANPQVLILDEPTRGIDVGARFEIYQLIHRLADEGAGILVVSSDLEELLGICDRILVMSRGEIRDELPRATFDRERIMRAALGNSKAHAL